MKSSARLAVSFRSPHPSTIGPRSLGLEWQQTWRWDLGSWVCRAAMTRKYPYVAQPLCPMRRLNILRLLRPCERQCLSNVGGAALLHERDEIEQRLAFLPKLKSQSATHGQVLLNSLTQRCHRAPPGQGNASV